MLLLVIALAWLAVVTVVVAVCQAAARGDAAQARNEQAGVEPIGERHVALDVAGADVAGSASPAGPARGSRAHRRSSGAGHLGGRRPAVHRPR